MKNKIQYYEVHWKGYTNDDNTFEKRYDLIVDAPKLIKRFETQYNVKRLKNTVKYDN